MPIDPNAAIPTDIPTYSDSPGLQVSMSSGHMRSTKFKAEQMWVSDWIQADEKGREVFRWAYFNRFEVDYPEVTHTEWRVTPQTPPQTRVVELGDGTCQQEQATVETEYSFRFAVLKQYYEQWVVDTALRDYYNTFLSTESTAVAGAVGFAALFGEVAFERAAAGIAGGTLTTTTGTLGGAGTAGAAGSAGGVLAVGAAGLAAFIGTTAIMSKIVKDTDVRSSGWVPIGKWKYEETPTGNTRTTWNKIGVPYPCPKKRAVTGGDPGSKPAGQAGGSGATTPVDPAPADPERARRWRLFWWLLICGFIVLLLIVLLIVFLATRPQAVVAPGGDGPARTASSYGATPAWCAGVWHLPSQLFLSSPSWFMFGALAVPDDDGELVPGTAFEATTPGADVASVSGIVGPGGEIAAIVPVSSYNDYAVTGIELTAPDGTVATIDAPGMVTVGPQQSGFACTGDAVAGEQIAMATWPGSAAMTQDDASAFLADYESWHATGDVQMLVDALHPASIQRYGTEQCAAYLEGVAGTVSDITLVGFSLGVWDYPRDGLTTQVLDGATATVDAQFSSGPSRTDLHLAPYAGSVRWFTDCGDPIS